jgi:periplasmic protein TonB
MFEQLLFSGRDRDRTSARRLSFPAAAGLHVAALVAVVGASLWATEELPDPPVPVVFHPLAVPSGPAGSNPGAGRPSGTRVLPLRAPRAIPTMLPSVPPEGETSVPLDATEGSDGRGQSDGQPGGVPGGPGPVLAVGLEPSAEPPRPGGDIRAPDLVRRIEPVYPEAARRARLEGLVVLDAIIAVNGEIEDVRVVKSAGPLFDSAAADAVRLWKYRPATLNGRAVRVLLTVSVSFRLH